MPTNIVPRWLRRPPLLLVAALALQSSGFWLAGCAAQRASPVRVDSQKAQSELRRDVAACADRSALHDLLAREIVEYAALVDRLASEAAQLRAAAGQAAAISDRGQPIPGALVDELNRDFSIASDTTRRIAVVATRHDLWRRRDAPAQDLELRVLGAGLSAVAALAG